MSATTQSPIVEVDRDTLARFIVEVDALATVEIIRSGGIETPLVEHIYRVIEQFERETLGYALAADEHASGIARGRDLFLELQGGRADDDAR